MYTLKLKVWRRNKYGEPDETRFFGEYFSKDAVLKDVEALQFRFMFCGWDKFSIEICDKEQSNDGGSK